jgi:glycosyltransferase involved in cell wall biosynthesis
MKTIKQSNSHGFVTIYDENKNKNPKFQRELLKEISSKYDEKITIVNLAKNKQNEIYDSNFTVLENIERDELIQIFKMHSTYIHTSEFETVGLPIYEALESGLKVVVPNLDYLNLTNENIFKYEFGNYSSAIKACNESIKNLEKVYCDVPIYYENWDLD